LAKHKAKSKKMDLVCYRCGREGHFSSDCYAHTTVDGISLRNNNKRQKVHHYIQSNNIHCFRCGRKGHYSTSCFAKTSIDGEELDDDNAKTSIDGEELDDESNEDDDDNKQVGGVYVLKSKDSNMFYVGKSNDIQARIKEHKSNDENSSAFLKQKMQNFDSIKPLTIGSIDDLESWERNETLHLMRIHGIENVRGWMFTTVNLSTEHKKDAFKQICEKFDLCRHCGRSSHFVNDCVATSMDFWCPNL